MRLGTLATLICDKHRCEYVEKDFQFHVEGGSSSPKWGPNVPPKQNKERILTPSHANGPQTL